MEGDIRIEEWSVKTLPGQEYMAPEVAVRVLEGRVYGHPRKPDGRMIVTSDLVSAEGRVVKTHSGSVYLLGAIDPKYLAWMRENGFEYDPENPIKMRR
jgi:hypothetical protein